MPNLLFILLLLCALALHGCKPEDDDGSPEPKTETPAPTAKAHDPSRLLEVAPGVFGMLSTTDSNDPNQTRALLMHVLDTNAAEPAWTIWQTWAFGEAIPGVETWHLPWMEQYGYERDNGFDEYHRELAMVAPSFYRPDEIYFTLWNEPGAVAAEDRGDEPAMYRAIYRATASGTYPNQTWTMEPYPVYYSDSETFAEGRPRGIDACVWDGPDGARYMTFGSWDPEGAPVICIADLDETTGRIKGVGPDEPGNFANAETALHPVATFGEAAASYYRDGWYYLFVNLGSCCNGVNSTYEIVVGRAQSVYGPYVDREGRSFADVYDYDAANFPGAPLLSARGRFIGPGHAGIFEHPDGRLCLTYHYYDGEDSGISKPALRELAFDEDGWPFVVSDEPFSF